MDVEAGRSAHKAIGDFGEHLVRQTGVHFVFRILFAEIIVRPVFGKLSEPWNLSELTGLALIFFVLFLDGFDDSISGNSGGLRVNLPERWMILNALIESRLRDGGIIDFAMTVAAIADEVDHYIRVKFGAIFGSEAANAHYRVRIFRVHMKDRHALALG